MGTAFEKKLRKLKKRWSIVTDGACLTIFDHNFKFHSFNKFNTIPVELRPFQLETQLVEGTSSEAMLSNKIFSGYIRIENKILDVQL